MEFDIKPMKFLCLSFLIVLAINGQCQVLFRDDFQTKTGGWKINSEVKPKIENGILTIDNINGDADIFYFHKISVEGNQPFVINASLKIPAVTGSIGIRWGSLSNSYCFVINKNQEYALNRIDGDGYIQIKEWTSISNVETDNYNKLSVEYTGGRFLFSINGILEYESSPLSFVAHNVGFIVTSECNMQADYLEFLQKQHGLPKSGESELRRITKDLGPNINSKVPEESPCISADGRFLFFSRALNETDSDIFVAERSNGKFMPAKNIGKPLNNVGPNFVVGVSADANTLYLGNKYSKDGRFISGQGVSVARSTKDGWSVPKSMLIRGLQNYSKFFHLNISQDRQTMVICMQNDKFRFDLDLYISFFQPDSTWSEPVNLGSRLNSLGNEATAFLAADNVTLYYSSNGRYGYGAYDLYVTRRLDDSWLRWSEPLNMGKSINTANSEMSLAIPAGGSEGYIVTQTEHEQSNIFSISLPSIALPEPSALISGKVFDIKTNAPLEAEVHYENLSTQRSLGSSTTSPVDGTFKIILPGGHEYGVSAKVPGYYPLSKSINIKLLKKYEERTLDLFLVPVREGAVVELNNIFFDIDQYTLKPESYPELIRLYNFLLSNPLTEIEISGHTDDLGDDEYNIKLSEQRAQEVLSFLLKKGGIDSSRLTVRGYGKSRPKLSNNTQEGRKLNRRVEFQIIK